MQSGRAVRLPSLEGVLAKALPLFFAIHVLCNRLAHQLVRSALTRFRQALQSDLDVIVNFDRHRANGSGNNVSLRLRWYALQLVQQQAIQRLEPSFSAPMFIRKLPRIRND